MSGYAGFVALSIGGMAPANQLPLRDWQLGGEGDHFAQLGPLLQLNAGG